MLDGRVAEGRSIATCRRDRLTSDDDGRRRFRTAAISASRTPPATTLATCPAALAPIACINRKFSKSSSCPTRWTTRAAIGNALIPAAPISGLNLPPRYGVDALREQHARGGVAREGDDAQRQDASVRLQELLPHHGGADGEAEEQGHDVGDLVRGAFVSRSTAPDSRMRLPSISDADERRRERHQEPTTMVTTIGKRTRVRLLTVRSV